MGVVQASAGKKLLGKNHGKNPRTWKFDAKHSTAVQGRFKIMQLLSCSSNITLSLPALCRELNFHNGYLSLLYFWPQVQCKSNYVKASRRRLLCTHLCDHYAPLITLTSSKRSKALDRLCTRLDIMTFLTLLPNLDQYPQRLCVKNCKS